MLTLVLKDESCSAYVLKRRRTKSSRGWGINNSTTTDLCSLKERYGESKQLTSQHDWSNRLRRPIWLVQATGLTARSNRSDRPEQPVRPVEVAAEQKAELELPISALCDGETPLAFSVQGNEELVEHETTPKAQRYGAQRHLSARGAKYWQMIIYLMKFLCNRSVCKGLSRLWLCICLELVENCNINR